MPHIRRLKNYIPLRLVSRGEKGLVITMKLIELFRECICFDGYIPTPMSGDYKIVFNGRVAEIYFQHSDGFWDWVSNFDFAVRPYKRMDSEWRCHRGFLRVFKAMRDEIAAIIGEAVRDGRIDKAVCVGYSHGAPLALLAVEDLSFRFGDRISVCGFGFGAPRVIWGKLPEDVRERVSGFTAVNVAGDLVSNLPPKLFGFKDPDNVCILASKGDYGPIEAHVYTSIIAELEKIPQKENCKCP